MAWVSDFRFGSKGDLMALKCDFRFNSKSGHRRAKPPRPKSASSGPLIYSMTSSAVAIS
jgi:hypothetical protein